MVVMFVFDKQYNQDNFRNTPTRIDHNVIVLLDKAMPKKSEQMHSVCACQRHHKVNSLT